MPPYDGIGRRSLDLHREVKKLRAPPIGGMMGRRRQLGTTSGRGLLSQKKPRLRNSWTEDRVGVYGLRLPAFWVCFDPVKLDDATHEKVRGGCHRYG